MSFFTHQHWSVFPSSDQTDLSTYFPSMNAVFDLQGDIISSSDQSEIFAHHINNKTYFVKRYFASKGFASWFGFSRFRVELKNQLWFNQINMPAAKVVAYGEERLLFKTKRGVLILEGINNVTDLAELAKHKPEKFNDRAWCNALTLQVANILKTLHSHSFCHNDMHWRNVLVQTGKTDGELQAYLIDCPFGRKLFWPFLNYKKLKDLANIDKFAPQYLSRTQRLRFFYEYRQISKLRLKDKVMILDILKHKASRLKRKARENK